MAINKDIKPYRDLKNFIAVPFMGRETVTDKLALAQMTPVFLKAMVGPIQSGQLTQSK